MFEFEKEYLRTPEGQAEYKSLKQKHQDIFISDAKRSFIEHLINDGTLPKGTTVDSVFTKPDVEMSPVE